MFTDQWFLHGSHDLLLSEAWFKKIESSTAERTESKEQNMYADDTITILKYSYYNVLINRSYFVVP